ncbi:MAG: hypothetical protein FWG66_14035 [Spirochaetes bacterium]|nr:hypothetical protein [Spirochaetota bacterium]
MVTLKNNNTRLELHDIKSFEKLFREETFDLSIVKELLISGSAIDDFSFINQMASLKKLAFLACKGNSWDSIPGLDTLKVLRLHNIKQNKEYIKNIDFIAKFQNLEYIYLKMLGIEAFPALATLDKLHTVCCSNRKLNDYSSLEYAKSLDTFIGWMETDNHRTPAEAFIPILKNKSLTAFQYVQRSNVEEKKLDALVKEYCPDITSPIDSFPNGVLNNEKTMSIIANFF